MTNEQILKKAIEKAMENIEEEPEKNSYRYYLDHWDNYIGDSQFKSYIIFSHSFAKAFWKDAEVLTGVPIGMEWTSHLQAMVVHPNPLEYLEKFL